MKLSEITKIRVNYDGYKTPVPKNLNSKHLAILKLMMDGKARERADMIRSATNADPNPRSESGFAGWNKLDYDLYKKGLLDVVDIKGRKKIFRINAAGRKAAEEFAPARNIDPANTEIETWFERDRAMVSLLATDTEETIVEWWDEDVQQAVDDGFLDPKDWHGSAVAYAQEMRLM